MDRAKLFRPYSVKNNFTQVWSMNFHRGPGEGSTDKCTVAKSPYTFWRTLLDLTSLTSKELREQQIVLSMAIVGTSNYNPSAISKDKYSCIPACLAIMRPSGESLLIPMSIYESDDRVAEAGRKAFHAILKDKRFIKVFYGLAAMRNFLGSWVPEDVVAEARSIYDLAYMYHGYPNSPLSKYGAIIGIKDYQELPDAKTLPGMFRQTFGVECSITQPVWHEKYWNELSGTHQMENMVQWLAAQLDLFVLFLLIGTPRYLPDPLQLDMDRLQKKLDAELVGLEDFLYIANWIVVCTQENMEWEEAEEEGVIPAGCPLQDKPLGEPTESDAGPQSSNGGDMRTMDTPGEKEEMVIPACSLQLDMQLGESVESDSNINNNEQVPLEVIQAMESLDVREEEKGSVGSEQMAKVSTMEAIEADEAKKDHGPVRIPSPIFKLVRSYSNQILLHTSSLPPSKVLRGIYAFGQVNFFAVLLCRDILCFGSRELLSPCVRLLKMFVFTRAFTKNPFNKGPKPKARGKQLNRRQRKARREARGLPEPVQPTREEIVKRRQETLHRKDLKWRQMREQAREGRTPMAYQIKQTWLQRRVKRFRDLKRSYEEVGKHFDELVAIRKRFQHCPVSFSNHKVWAAKVHLRARKAKSLAETELLRTRQEYPLPSQPGTVDPTAEKVDQVEREFAKMVHLEERKRKNFLSRLALVKNRQNLTAAEYQQAVEKLEQEMRLLSLQQQKRNVTFWEYHVERLEREEALGQMDREYQQRKPILRNPEEEEARKEREKHRRKRYAYYKTLNQLRQSAVEKAQRKIEERARQLLILNFGLSPEEAKKRAENELFGDQP